MTKDQEWIVNHFEEIVNEYGGKYIAVVKETLVAVGDSPKEVDEIARKKFPGAIPSVMHVPKEE
ncbi:hypothetical protein IBX65_01875, partial [Candidatus Aerophobetes bacterium]|nr:hypothetical protein [Candidatus Aerophobetes bacterium]